MTRVFPWWAMGSGVSEAPGHGPEMQRPVSGTYTAPWVAQIRCRPSSVKNSLGHQSRVVQVCAQRFT